VGELLLSLILLALFWPAALPSCWREHLSDRLALTIALMLALTGLAGLIHAAERLRHLT
jgi:hypothetical protein